MKMDGREMGVYSTILSTVYFEIFYNRMFLKRYLRILEPTGSGN